MTHQPKAVLSLSGGLDSYTAAALARSEGWRSSALPILYGQRHAVYIVPSQRVAHALVVERRLARCRYRKSAAPPSSVTADSRIAL